MKSKSEWHQTKVIRTSTLVVQGGAEVGRQQGGDQGGGGGRQGGGRGRRGRGLGVGQGGEEQEPWQRVRTERTWSQ